MKFPYLLILFEYIFKTIKYPVQILGTRAALSQYSR